jgi:protein involved in polysaccharide export with SLBB domain
MDGITAKGSRRIAHITSANGTLTICDLFQAQRYGDLSHNPYILPGDRIYIPPAGRVIDISGQVYRPGVYELLPDEGMAELISLYADGMTLLADDSRISLTRIDTEGGISGERLRFTWEDIEYIPLMDRDTVVVADKIVNRPVAIFQGAITTQVQGVVDQTSANVQGMAILEYPFYEGETLGNAVRSINGRFSASSDIGNAYLVRAGEQIKVDLRRFLYYNDFSGDLTLENGDIVIVPFYQYFVLVSGAVKLPGRYPYVPDRKIDYYINLAGGIDQMLSNGRGFQITDLNDNVVEATDYVLPESKIFVPTNAFSAKFNRYGPIVTTFLSIVTTLFSFLALTGLFG